MSPRLLIILSFVLSVTAKAQSTNSGTIKVSIFNEKESPFENVTVALLKAKDSSLVKVALTDNKGVAEFEKIVPGSYLVKASMVNYGLQYAPVELNELNREINLTKLSLSPQATQLGAVTVTGKKPFIQKLNDRLIVNVENSIVSAGSSAMDVLERSPGVSVDQNDVFGLRGKQGVIIMIDGKPSPMTGADLANYLRGLPSNAIERIEIITNPSAKYDAAGNSGIIDIRMKKDQRFGINGTLTASYGQGVYPKANAGTTFNYRNKKVNLFGNYNYGYRKGLNHLYLDRNFYENGNFKGRDLKDNFARFPFNSNVTRLGADFFPNKKTIIGFVVNANFNHFRRTTDNNATVINQAGQLVSTFQTRAGNNDHFNNVVANVNFKHSFDSTGRELTADLDYGEFNSNSLSYNVTKYYKTDGTALQDDYRLDGDQDGKLKLKTGKVDYVHPLKNKARIETGGKISFVSSDNDAKFFDVSSGVPENDVNKTNHFFYEENNNAAYINFSKAYKKFDWQVGLRGEQTNIKTHQVKGNIKFDSSYFQLFPSAFINYHIKEDQTVGVSVSRRIDRPGYSQLNPFLFLIDVTTYATGSPGLLPQLTWSYELNYTLKSLNFTLGYSHTKNNQNIAIARFKDVFPNIPSDENVTIQIPINLESSDYFGLTIAAPVRITKWWNMINNGNLYYNHFNGNLAGTTLNNGKPAFDMSTNNSFSFKKGWGAELNGSFNSGGQYGFMVSKPQWGISSGVQKTVLKSKGTLRLNVTDIFWTNRPRATITYPGVYIEKWHAYRESRVATLSFTYRFGSNKIQAARRRTTGSEEERQRAGN
ncbi:outer membrane beta-barrel protein [Terrimonas pollutisoli]|uniref:outer membrane beta-barrel protein n=1 Tax=Terrimonas pollutisoli TaxID=3034147 RepID=UPI0023EC8235|nr:outer membrane beta-barrel protein [Terrimonas sp. H1YJ31]